jgi:acyl-coenzyme A synthetase/AMP-(fatty) acid ligase
MADAFATYLDDSGYEQGDIVFVMLHNIPQFYVAYYGAHKAGLVVAPPFPEPDPERIEHHLDELETDVVVTHEEFADEVGAVRDRDAVDLANVIYVSYDEYLPDDPVPTPPEGIPAPAAEKPESLADGERYLQAIVEETEPDPPSPDIDLDDLAYLMHSGGTTGVPKGVEHTFHNQLWKSASYASIYEYGEKDTILQTFPVCRTGGTVTAFPQMIHGNTAVIMRNHEYDPESIMGAVDAYGVNYAMVLTSDVHAMLDHPDLPEYDLRSLEYTSVVSFTQDPTEELAAEWRDVTGGGLSDYTYGGVEVHGPGTWTYELGIIEPGFVGLPHHGVEVTIRDFDTGEPLPTGELGEIAIDDEALMEGYWKRPEKNEEVFAADGSFLTDDAGRLSEEGYLYFFGRNDELIDVGGQYVAPKEVEFTLEDHPAVENAGVVWRETDGGKEVVAFVSASGDVTDEELTAWADETMESPLAPAEVRIVAELPMTSVGKLDRRSLRDRVS